MHSLLEAYLSEVAAHLGPMPVKRRKEELREMRAHLENAVIVSRELGQTEEEAAQNVVVQFGTPQDLGENVVWAWRRGAARNRRGLYRSAACTFTLLFFLPLLMIPFPIGPWVLCACGATSPLIAGAMCGDFFSKSGLTGIALGLALYFYGLGGTWAVFCMCHPVLCHCTGSFSHTLKSFIDQQTQVGLFTLFIAWAVNWGRLRRVERSRLARG